MMIYSMAQLPGLPSENDDGDDEQAQHSQQARRLTVAGKLHEVMDADEDEAEELCHALAEELYGPNGKILEILRNSGVMDKCDITAEEQEAARRLRFFEEGHKAG